TGEDVLELHGHGGVVVQDRVLRAALAAGCRIARPGEFSERAFLNDRLDLAQAEAIADLIESGSETAAKAAMRSLRGEFSDAVNQLLEQLTELRMYVEAAIDFPEEEVDFLGDVEITQRVATVRTTFDVLRAAAGQGALLHDGLTVVIAGPPNAGKSSLLNALAGYAAAIVTDIPGTTRDLLRERLQVDGLPLHIVDTAGLREPGDAVEQEGVRRARAEIETADCALLVVDDTDSDQDVDALLKEFGALPVLVLRNKTDLSGTSTGLRSESPITLGISAKTGAGLDALRQQLKALAGYRPSGEGTFMARRRHLDALDRARQHLETGWQQLVEAKAGELMAEELRLAQQALGEVTGEFTSDDLLGRIFASFCIGK
ncbi:MAG: tRNA uridine-5-carboxymethylaminomethyl(34) synthesis GTPase MnmE, partial [Gammaproteobacteria bacterium]